MLCCGCFYFLGRAVCALLHECKASMGFQSRCTARHALLMLYLGMEVSSLMRRASQVDLVVKNLPTDIGDVRDSDSALGSGRSPGRGHGNPLQCFCLENPIDRGAWRAPVLGVAESDTAERLSVHVQCSAVVTVGCDEDQAGIRPRLSRAPSATVYSPSHKEPLTRVVGRAQESNILV